MATLALPNPTGPTAASVGLLLSPSHQQQSRHHTPRQQSVPSTITTTTTTSSRSRVVSAPVCQSSVGARHSTTTTTTTTCDNATSASPPVTSSSSSSPLVQSIRSFSNGANSNSPPNYILLNKLRIQQHTRKNAAVNGVSAIKSTATTPVANIRAQLQSHQLSGSRLSSSNALHSSTHSSPSRSSSGTSLVSRSSLSGPLSANGHKQSNPRSIVTRVTAQDWMQPNHYHRKDASTANVRHSSVSKPHVPISSSSPCTSLNDRTCLSSPLGFLNKGTVNLLPNSKVITTPSGKLSATSRTSVERTTFKVGSSSSSQLQTQPTITTVADKPIGTDKRFPSEESAHRQSGDVVSSCPSTNDVAQSHNTRATDRSPQDSATLPQSMPTQTVLSKEAESGDVGGGDDGQMRLQHAGDNTTAATAAAATTTTTETIKHCVSDIDESASKETPRVQLTADRLASDLRNGVPSSCDNNTDKHCDSANTEPSDEAAVDCQHRRQLRTPNKVVSVDASGAAADAGLTLSSVTNQPRQNSTHSKMSNTKQPSVTPNLLHFIEKASPELIFLLSESAKLNYQLTQFEQKLDYLEEIFCKQQQSNCESGSETLTNEASFRSDCSQASSWRSVIQRTRRWISSVRLKNVFLEKKPLSPTDALSFTNASPVTGGAHTQPVIGGSVQESTANRDKVTDHISVINRSEAEISTEDELILLLDRIAKFSSNIVSKLPSQPKPLITTQSSDANEESDFKTAESTIDSKGDINLESVAEKLNSLNSPEDSGRSKYEWLQSLPSNIKDLMSQLFPIDSNTNTVSDEFEKDDPQFSHIFELNSELLKTLVENVKINARLTQLRREFDRLMCSHLKSLNHQSHQSQTQLRSSQPTIEPNLSSTSQSSNTVRLSLSQSNSTKTTLNARSVAKAQSTTTTNTSQSVKTREHHNHHQSDHSHESTTSKCNPNHTNCCCVANNMASDGDSGGEFTATTVTNEFNGSATTTDDELSSLLNQIALCSQKIIEQQTGTLHSNSSSSGCGCSANSIGGVCSLGPPPGHHFVPGGRTQLTDLARSGHVWHSTSDVFKPTPPPLRLAKQNNCQNCRHAKTSSANLHSQLKNPSVHTSLHHHQQNLDKLDNELYAKHSHYAPSGLGGMPHVQYVQLHHQWPLSQSFNDDYILHSSSLSPPIYSHHQTTGPNTSLNQKYSPKRTTNSDLSGTLNEPFMDNMTGFMFSSSALNLLPGSNVPPTNTQQSPYHKSHHYSRPPNQSQLYNNSQQHSQYPLDTNTSAFIFDPNVDVESFLNEVEKELDDNCFASAPPFMSHNSQHQQLTTNQSSLYFSPQTQSHRSSQPRLNHRTMSHAFYNNNHSGQQVHSPTLVGQGPANLVNQTPLSAHKHHHPKPQHSTTSEVYSSLNPNTNRVLSGYENFNTNQHQTSSMLAGGDNWRLSHRNSIPKVKMGLNGQMSSSHPLATAHQANTNEPNQNYFPFPATASMPLSNATLAKNIQNTTSGMESQRYKRVIVPSASRDLLDKFRSHVSYRVKEETQNQLREIDQWLQEHLSQSMTARPDESNGADSMGDFDGGDTQQQQNTLLASEVNNLIQFAEMDRNNQHHMM